MAEPKKSTDVIADATKKAEIDWPRPIPQDGDRLFRKDKSQARNWAQKFIRPFHTYTNGYQFAADQLCDQLDREKSQLGDKYPDWPFDEDDPPMSNEHWLIYPIYFLYRHAIELSLKALLRHQKDLGQLPMKQIDEVTNCHNPLKLWKMAEPWVATFATAELAESTKAFESILEEIDEHDPNGDAGRYDLKKVGKGVAKQFVITFPNIAPLELKTVQHSATAVLNYIRWVWSSYEQHLEQQRVKQNL